MNPETLSTIVKILMGLGIGTAIGVFIFGCIFAFGCIFGGSLDDAMQDRDWRGSDAQADARRGK